MNHVDLRNKAIQSMYPDLKDIMCNTGIYSSTYVEWLNVNQELVAIEDIREAYTSISLSLDREKASVIQESREILDFHHHELIKKEEQLKAQFIEEVNEVMLKKDQLKEVERVSFAAADKEITLTVELKEKS